MSPGILIPMMSTLTLNFTSDSTTLSIPKLHDDRSNWSDYEPHIQRVMGSKSLWRHVEGTASHIVQSLLPVTDQAVDMTL